MPAKSESLRNAASRVADAAAILTVVSLPWSTSATSILVAVWIVALLPTLNFAELKRECATPYGGIPVLLFGLAVLSIIWSEASLWQSVVALRSALKLLAIPFLIVQFRKSDKAQLAIGGYLLACSVLLAASLISMAFPRYAWGYGFKYPGVAVKDAFAQSEEFAICGFGLILWARATWAQQRYRLTAVLALWAALFFAAILYVATSRTELIALVVLLALLLGKWIGWKGVPIGLALAGVLFALAWVTSPYLRARVNHVAWELQQYSQNDRLTSAGARLEFWRKSLDIVRAAPVIGHGVGSIKGQFAARATGTAYDPATRFGATAAVTDNPHNQILAIAIEMGLIGVAALFAMWIAHVRLFQGVLGAPWLGMMIVVQNIVGSLFNSHLYDFTQGWTYVFGVGVLGGMALSPAKEYLGAKVGTREHQSPMSTEPSSP